MERSRRRIVLVATVLAGAFASCSVTRLDDAQVRSVAAVQLDCEPDLVKLESLQGSDSKIARYIVHGCGQTRTLDCVQGRTDVHCMQPGGGSGGSSEGSGGDVAAAAVATTAGCACANLLAHHHDDRESTPASTPSPMSTTPQRNR